MADAITAADLHEAISELLASRDVSEFTPRSMRSLLEQRFAMAEGGLVERNGEIKQLVAKAHMEKIENMKHYSQQTAHAPALSHPPASSSCPQENVHPNSFAASPSPPSDAWKQISNTRMEKKQETQQAPLSFSSFSSLSSSTSPSPSASSFPPPPPAAAFAQPRAPSSWQAAAVKRENNHNSFGAAKRQRATQEDQFSHPSSHRSFPPHSSHSSAHSQGGPHSQGHPNSQANNGSGEDFLDLSQGSGTRRLSVSVFNGRVRVDIREYYADKSDGLMKPGKKGISLTEDQFELIASNIQQIQAKIEAARR